MWNHKDIFDENANFYYSLTEKQLERFYKYKFFCTTAKKKNIM